MKKMTYSVETKLKAIEMKLQGYKTRDIIELLNIKNETQVIRWWKWYRDGQSYRFSQPMGKQYAYGKNKQTLNNEEQLKMELKRKEAEIDILKKYKELERQWYQK